MKMEQKINPMQEIKIEKVVLSIGATGDDLEKGVKLLQLLSGKKPAKMKSKKRIPGWNVRPGLEIGCRVTIRGAKAKALLKALLQAKKNELKASIFDNNGNFSFGVPEYLDVPNIEYDPDIGIIGFEVAVTLQRKGRAEASGIVLTPTCRFVTTPIGRWLSVIFLGPWAGKGERSDLPFLRLRLKIRRQKHNLLGTTA